MLRVRLCLAVLALCPVGLADSNSPNYSAAGIVNAADNQTRSLAPNTITCLYGVRLSYVTAAISPGDIHSGVLPTSLPGTGVQVLVRNVYAAIYYVSPTQINFLVPADLLPGPAAVQVLLDGHAGPAVDIQVAAASPALFQLDAHHAIAIRPDGSVITPEAPAKPGEIVILYATGLGQTIPPVSDGQVMQQATPIEQLSEFKLVLNGVPAGSKAVAYAGIAPGFAGLYQLNVILPKAIKANPEIRIGLGSKLSMAGLHISVE